MFEDRVEKGAKLLDEYDPDWFKKIDLDTLQLYNCVFCVLGQLFRKPHNVENNPYCEGLRILFNNDYGTDTNHESALNHGFICPSDNIYRHYLGISDLTKAWKEVILARRRQTPVEQKLELELV